MALAASLLLAGKVSHAQATCNQTVRINQGLYSVTPDASGCLYEVDGDATLRIERGAGARGVYAGENAPGTRVELDSGAYVSRNGITVYNGTLEARGAAGDTPIVIENRAYGHALQLRNTSGVLSNAELVSHSGASYASLDMDRGSRVTLTDVNASSAGWGFVVYDAGTTLDMTRTTVSADGQVAVLLGGGAAVSAVDSSFTGPRGVEVGAGSTFSGQGVTATGTRNVGLVAVEGATVSLRDSQISGALGGILVGRYSPSSGAATDRSDIHLHDTRVTSQQGAAIIAGGDAHAAIRVSGNSELSAANGRLLDVQNASAEFSVEQSQLRGDVVAAMPGSVSVALSDGASLSGNLVNVGQVQIGANSQWNLPGSNTIGDLVLNDGTVNLGGEGNTVLRVEGELSGAGVISMRSNLADLQSDMISVGGAVSGDHRLRIRDTGREPATGDGKLRVATTGGGAGTFRLDGGYVDVGAYSYTLDRDENDWYLQHADVPRPSASAATAIGMFMAPATISYEQLGILRTRMGELRRQEGSIGAWGRVFGSRYRVGNGQGVSFVQDQSGVSVGVDKRFHVATGSLLAGASFTYSNSRLDFGSGADGTIDSQALGGYMTWLRDDGYYVDAALQASRFGKRGGVPMNDGTRASGNDSVYGVIGSFEVGRQIALRSAHFVEPYAQLTGMVVNGNQFTISNGMNVSGGHASSLQAQVGVTAGRDVVLANGGVVQPYLRVAAVNEFMDGGTVKVNDIGFSGDMSGWRGEVGAGVTARVGNAFHLFAEYSYANGRHIEKPWAISGGMRYAW